MEAGVPQRLVLGPFLFNIYIMKLEHSNIAQFADDTATYTHSIVPETPYKGYYTLYRERQIPNTKSA